MAKAWTRLHQPDKAVEVWRAHVDERRAATPADDSRLAYSLSAYGRALLKNDQAKDAEPVLRECLSIREKAPKKNDQRIAEARRVLGECLAGQGADPSLALGARIEKLREAEPLLLEGYEGMKDHPDAIDLRKGQALERIVKLYDAWHAAEPDQGHDAKAAEWRAKLASGERTGTDADE